MACGVHLGILLICLVQAERVCCLWAAQAQSSQSQSSNNYVGFSQQNSGLKRLGGNYLQNQLRQPSVSSGYSQGPSSSGYKQTLSLPAQSGYPSVKMVQGSSAPKANWRTMKSTQVNVQTLPKKFPGLSTAIASGSSTKSSKNQKDRSVISKTRTWPVQQGTLRASKYVSSSSASVQRPSSESYSFRSASRPSAPQKASSESYSFRSASRLSEPQNADIPAYYGQRGYSQPVKSSSLFSAGAPVLQRNAVQKQTSATAPARRVSSHLRSKPSRFASPQAARTQSNPRQAEAGQPYQSKLFPVSSRTVQGSYQPISTDNVASNYVSSSRSLPMSNKRNAPVSGQPGSLQVPGSQRLSSTEQHPSRASSGQHFAPSVTHSIPKRYGGYAIRRLKNPDKWEASVKKPQQTNAVLSWQSASYRPQVQSVHSESKWKRIRPHYLQH